MVALYCCIDIPKMRFLWIIIPNWAKIIAQVTMAEVQPFFRVSIYAHIMLYNALQLILDYGFWHSNNDNCQLKIFISYPHKNYFDACDSHLHHIKLLSTFLVPTCLRAERDRVRNLTRSKGEFWIDLTPKSYHKSQNCVSRRSRVAHIYNVNCRSWFFKHTSAHHLLDFQWKI